MTEKGDIDLVHFHRLLLSFKSFSSYNKDRNLRLY